MRFLTILICSILMNGYIKAQIYLGHCYYHGNGVIENKEKAARFYQMAANQDNIWGHIFYLNTIMSIKVI